jgi:hypothetical protein
MIQQRRFNCFNFHQRKGALCFRAKTEVLESMLLPNRPQLLIFFVALIGHSGVQAFMRPALVSFMPASRFKSTVTKSGAKVCSMQSDSMVGNRFEDDGQESIVRAQSLLHPSGIKDFEEYFEGCN